MTSLYELTNDYKDVEFDMLENGIDEQTIHDTLEGIVAPIEEKAVNVAKFIGNMDSDIDGIKVAIANMNARKKALESKRDNMTSYLKRNMEAAGIDRIACPFFELAVVNNPGKLVVTGDIPKEFMIEVPATEKPNNAAIKKACADGLEFAHIEKSTRLRIK